VTDPSSSPAAQRYRPRPSPVALLEGGAHRLRHPAPNVDTLGELEAKGARTLALGVTDEASIVAAVQAVEAEYGAVGTSSKQPGSPKYGAFENVPLDEARRQLRNDVFGLARMTQLVLPAMLRPGAAGSSTSPRWRAITFPFGTWVTTPPSTPSRPISDTVSPGGPGSTASTSSSWSRGASARPSKHHGRPSTTGETEGRTRARTARAGGNFRAVLR